MVDGQECREAPFQFRECRITGYDRYFTWCDFAHFECEIPRVAGCNNASSIKQETVLTEGRLDVAEGVNSVLHTENSLPPTQAIMQVATDAQISNARNSFVVPYAEGRAARRYKDQDDKQGEGPSDLELTIASVRASEPWYACGYCGTRKASTSAGGDGRVRIRCECGGKHKDRKARMHANWRPCSPDAHRAVYLHSC